MAEVIWSAQAVADLDGIDEYIARDSERYAVLTVARLVEAVDRPRQFPKSGRMVPEVGDEAVREVIRGAYRIVYELRGGRVEAVTVVHGARELPGLGRAE